jgi:hypothetical protein
MNGYQQAIRPTETGTTLSGDSKKTPCYVPGRCSHAAIEFGYVAAGPNVRAISVNMGDKMYRDSDLPHCFEGIFVRVGLDSRESRTASLEWMCRNVGSKWFATSERDSIRLMCGFVEGRKEGELLPGGRNRKAAAAENNKVGLGRWQSLRSSGRVKRLCVNFVTAH